MKLNYYMQNKIYTSLESFLSMSYVGSKSLLILGISGLSFFFDLRFKFLALTIFIFLDLVTGVLKYLHLNKIKIGFSAFRHIKSELLRKTIKKAYEYGLFLITAIVLDILIFDIKDYNTSVGAFNLSEIAIIILSVIEIWSLFENIEKITDHNIIKRISLLLPSSVRGIMTYNKKDKLDDKSDEDTE